MLTVTSSYIFENLHTEIKCNFNKVYRK